MAFRELNLHLYKDASIPQTKPAQSPETSEADLSSPIRAIRQSANTKPEQKNRSLLKTSAQQSAFANSPFAAALEPEQNLWQTLYDNQSPVMKGWLLAMMVGLGLFSIHLG